MSDNYSFLAELIRDLKITYAKGTAQYLTHGRHLEMKIIIIIKDRYNYSPLQLRELRPKRLSNQARARTKTLAGLQPTKGKSSLWFQNLKCEKSNYYQNMGIDLWILKIVDLCFQQHRKQLKSVSMFVFSKEERPDLFFHLNMRKLSKDLMSFIFGHNSYLSFFLLKIY